MTLASKQIFWQRKGFYLNSTVASDEIQKIVWEGDSLAFATFGVGYLYLRPPTVVNLAVPGSTTADMTARAGGSGQVDDQIATNACLVVWGGPYNALATVANTVAAGDAVADQFLTYLDDRFAAGWGQSATRMLVINMMRRGNSPAGYPQIAWAQCAARLTADVPAHSSGPVIEVADMPGTPGDSRYYNSDLVHGNPIGYQWIHEHRTAPTLFAVRF